MISLLVLLIAGVLLIRAIPAGLWAMVLGIVGALTACGLVVVLFVLLAWVPSWHPPRPGILPQVDYLWADERASSESPARPAEIKESAIRPIDLSDDRQSPAQYAAERAEIERLWHDAELERRLWHAGSVAGGLFAWLAVATAYLNFDLRSSGRYRGRLRLAAATGVLLATAAAAWAWMQPL
jgi:hypothetical protein